ncbi:hypothetical protein H6F61_12740 [Cyanobacteria bacterium FACHB-472]|nr:hypothetical protein [Cyanobacteria bacterium FACHB-472]
MDFEEVQEKRLKMLELIYQATEGNEEKSITREEISQVTSLSERNITGILNYLLNENMINCDPVLGIEGLYSNIWIEHKGILHIESILNNKNSPIQQVVNNQPILNSPYPMPDFTTSVSDAALAAILSNRWEEANKTFQAGAYLSTIILLGSILEALLLDKCQQNQAEAYKANSAPKDNQKKPVPLHQWKLADLINVAHECKWLTKDVKGYSDTLRSYRNLVHPNEQKKQDITPTSHTCKISWEVLHASLNDLGITTI